MFYTNTRYFYLFTNPVHSHLTRSADKLHKYSVYSSSNIKCIKYKSCRLWYNLPVYLIVLSSRFTDISQIITFLERRFPDSHFPVKTFPE